MQHLSLSTRRIPVNLLGFKDLSIVRNNILPRQRQNTNTHAPNFRFIAQTRRFSESPIKTLFNQSEKSEIQRICADMLKSSNVLENSFSNLHNRSVLLIQGPDSDVFLQGLTTNQMQRLSNEPGMYLNFLYSNGRVMADAFIYKNKSLSGSSEKSYLIEIDSSMKDTLLLLFKIHKLRSKIDFLDVSDSYSVWSIWGAHLSSPNHPSMIEQIINENYSSSEALCFPDTRAPNLGMRMVMKNSSIKKPMLPSEFIEKDMSEYTLLRTIMGVPEGPKDLIPKVSLPLELNLDLMNGVDFEKGCYVGQELTIRTHHRGVVRKRVIPVLLSSDNIYAANSSSQKKSSSLGSVDKTINLSFSSQSEAPIEYLIEGSEVSDPFANTLKDVKLARSRIPGKLHSSIYNVGLAVMRLDVAAKYQKLVFPVTDTTAGSASDFSQQLSSPPLVVKDSNNQNVFLTPVFPYWWF
ncbi:hypothetical protein BB560_000633 [Smittium megazygosporum]|uniref:Uncharacterized protein n=2 Tax=Smittium megazygosporum TaxID=133381 RepID=A0A2T9ZJR5_9FUNG|nr:hypothetical protein BB560_000633 [Smittium megazygosporum]